MPRPPAHTHDKNRNDFPFWGGHIKLRYELKLAFANGAVL